MRPVRAMQACPFPVTPGQRPARTCAHHGARPRTGSGPRQARRCQHRRSRSTAEPLLYVDREVLRQEVPAVKGDSHSSLEACGSHLAAADDRALPSGGTGPGPARTGGGERAGACSHRGSAARSRRHRGTWQPPQALQGLRGPWPDARSMEDRNISMTTSMDQSKLSVIFRKQVIDCHSLLSTYSPAIDLPVTKTTPSAGHTRSSGTSARACPERRAWASVIGTASRTSEPPPSPRAARRSNIRVGAWTTQISDTQRADTSRKASAPCRQ